MCDRLHLVGSIPLETAETVMRTVGPALGPHLRSMPDGEVLDRRFWTMRVQFQVFNGHPDLEVVRRPRRENGVERVTPRDRADAWRFRVRPGVATVRFDQPGWRLGFAKDAVNSYSIFKGLRREGVIPTGVRFQVSLPSVNSTCNPSAFESAEDLAAIRPGFEEALAAEAANICRLIPGEDLALQYDCSWEITDVYGATSLPPEGAMERNLAQFATLCAAVPEPAALGFHLCFGTFGGWPRFAPPDLGRAVEFANALVERAGRRVDWVHIPTLDTVDDAFYAPLENLRLGDAAVYLGMIHSMDSFPERLAAAKRRLPAFGLAAYCGLGRLPPEEVGPMLDAHRQALELARAQAQA